VSPSTVLFVDDEARILSAFQRGLRREGYRILVAPSPEKALDVLEAEPVDVLVTDQKMPGMSGLQLLERVALRWPGVRRVLITGWPEEIPPERVASLDIRALLPKPWDDAELKRVLQTLTGAGPPTG
jgi:CheY-like chemotaxis protein